MARLRTIKPAFFTNEQLAECSPYARLLYAGLRGRLHTTASGTSTTNTDQPVRPSTA